MYFSFICIIWPAASYTNKLETLQFLSVFLLMQFFLSLSFLFLFSAFSKFATTLIDQMREPLLFVFFSTFTSVPIYVKCDLTVSFHGHHSDFVLLERRVLDQTGHTVLVLQVGGEAEDAAHGGGSVGVMHVAHVDSEGVA